MPMGGPHQHMYVFASSPESSDNAARHAAGLLHSLTPTVHGATERFFVDRCCSRIEHPASRACCTSIADTCSLHSTRYSSAVGHATGAPRFICERKMVCVLQSLRRLACAALGSELKQPPRSVVAHGEVGQLVRQSLESVPTMACSLRDEAARTLQSKSIALSAISRQQSCCAGH